MSWRPRFPLRRDSHAHGSRNQTPAFVLFEALQVDKRTDEGGGGREGIEGGKWGCIEEEKQVRHRSLVSAIWSERRQGDKRKNRQREEGSAASGESYLPVNRGLFFPTRAAARERKRRRRRRGRGRGTFTGGLHLFSCTQSLGHSAADRRSFI